MLRKIVIGLVAAASLSAMALVPTEASARALGGGGGRGGGFGGHHFASGGFGGRHFGGSRFGTGLGIGLGLDLIAAGIYSSGCRSAVTANGRVVTVC